MNLISGGCRLCLGSSAERFTTIDSPALKDQIEKVFWFSIKPKHGYCSGVCQSCSNTISEFYLYSEKVRHNQEVLNGNVSSCDKTKDSKFSLGSVKQEPLNSFELPETIDDALDPENEASEAEEVPILDTKIPLACVKREPLNDFGFSETIEDDHDPRPHSEAEEAPIMDPKISEENDTVQTPNDSEMMETNQDASELKDEVSEVEEAVHTLHSEITLEDFKIEITDADLPETIDEKKYVPIIDKVETPNESELSETTEPIVKKTQIRKEEDQLFLQHISMVCDICGITTGSYSALCSHFKERHKGRKSYVVCCNTKLFVRCQIREHINFHANPDMFRCEVCGRTFKGQDSLNIHMLKKHPKTHKCDHCVRSFAEESALIQHKNLHNKGPKWNQACTKKIFRNDKIKKQDGKAQGAHEPIFEASDSEEAPILDSEISHENDKVQMPSDSEIMETNQDACESKDEVLEVEDEFHTLHSEITLADSKIEITYSHTPETMDDKNEIHGLGLKTTLESVKVQTPSEFEISEMTVQIVKKTQNRKEEDELFKTHINMVCDLCGILADSYPALCSHIKEEHKRRYSYVVCCNKKLFRRNDIREHINFHANPDMFRCKVCGFRFKRQDNLNIHMLKKHSQTHKCEHCPQSFPEESALTEHMKLHIKCPKCNQLCSKKSFHNHMFRIHGVKTQTIICDICNKKFATTKYFNQHMKTHMEFQEFKCKICQKSFKIERNLNHHMKKVHAIGDQQMMKMHMGTQSQKFQCKICQQSLSNEKNLNHHMKNQHAPELQCDQCPKKFKNPQSLAAHKHWWHSEPRHKCEYCDKKFKKTLLLKEHLASAHTGEVLYTCEYCGISKNRILAMYKHMRRIHPAEWTQQKLMKTRGLIPLKSS